MRSLLTSRPLKLVPLQRPANTWIGWAPSWRNELRLEAGATSPLARRGSN